MTAKRFDIPIDTSAELAAAQAEAKYRGLFESAPDGRVITNRDGQIVAVNSRVEKMFGYDREEILGHSIDFLIGEHLLDAGASFFWADLFHHAGGRKFFGRRKDGSEFPVELSQSPLRNGEGPIVVTAIRDLTSRSDAEATLFDSEDRFRFVFENTTIPTAIAEANDRFVHVNAAFAQLFGHTEQAISTMSLDEIIHPDFRKVCLAHRETLLGGLSAHCEMEMAFLHEDGHLLWGLMNLTLVRNRSREPLRYIIQLHEITERKRLESLLHRSEQRLQHVVVSSPAVLYTMPADCETHSLTWVSDNIRETLGYSAEEALQQDWWVEHVHPEDLRLVQAETKELYMCDRVANEYRFRDRDGKYRWVRSEMRLLRDARGAPSEIVGSWLDLTERKHLEDQFRQSQKMEAVGRLAGGVAHDFNNILTVICGYSEMLLTSLRVGDPLHDFVDQIRKAGERAASLTRQLLAFSRKQVLHPVVLDINELLTDIDKMLSRLIGEDIELHLVARPGVGRVKVDRGQMEQVLMNLVVNARDAMPRGGKLTIETSNVILDEEYVSNHSETRAGAYIQLAVTDTGCGMNEATKSRIFEPFFTTKGPEKGTGLGLATVYGIVKQSGGHIDCYSEEGVGTSFKIYLPRAEEELAKSKIQAIPPMPARGHETILLVEDEDGVRRLAQLVLEKSGYKVLQARNGGEALLLCQQHRARIDIMVSDIVMPNMSGQELAGHLAPLRPNMKVLFLSGYTNEAVVHHGMIDDYTPFLQKPFANDALIRKVREVLDMKQGIADPSNC